MSEAIYKLQPNRTLHLRGSDGFGAHASLCNVTANSFNVFGVFRDQGDFTVLMIWDADNAYEHYSIKYLPDFNFSGVSLSFDVQYNGIQPFDSARYSWIGWAQIQTIQEDGDSSQAIYLFDHATLVSSASTFTPASGTFTFTSPTYGDNVYIVVNNVYFLYQAYTYTDTAASVAAYLAQAINNYNWSTYYNADVAVVASASGSVLTIEYGRTGSVSVSGATVTWVAGTKFPGLKVGDSINIGASVGNTVVSGNLQYTVASVNSPTSLTLSRAYSGVAASSLSYAAPYGGVDGNALAVYSLLNPANSSLGISPAVLHLAGGTSFDAVWNISFSFAAYGITALRQAWFTFAPALADEVAYAATEWSAAFTNWTVTDPSSVTHLQCAGPGSVRIGCYDSWTTFEGSWDNQDANDDTYLGRAKSLTASDAWVTTEPTSGVFDTSHTLTIASNSITIKYACGYTHCLYVGTFLYVDRGIVTISIDGGVGIAVDCYLNTGAPFPARRFVESGIASGLHTVTISLTGYNAAAFNAAQSATGSGSFPFYYWHDFIEAAVPSDLPSITQPTYAGAPKLSPALDYDTDQTYKLSPARTMWQIQKLGFTGDIDFYVGVFYWPNKIRGTNAAFGVSTVVFSGSFKYGDVITLTIGGTAYLKYVRDFGESNATIAAHFAYYINSGSVGVWASAAGGTLTITVRSTGSTYVYSVVAPAPTLVSGSTGAVAVTANGTDTAGVEGDWIVDIISAQAVNYPTRMFMQDLFTLCAAAGLQCVTAFSMELVNPPDWPTSPISSPGVWSARFSDGSRVATSTDLSYNGNLLSSTQCAPVSALTTFQEGIYAAVAGLQVAAGLTPWLQFGEFLWWFFSRSQNVAAGYVSFTTPISIGMAAPHGMSSGDRVIASGIEGMTSANGTWPITVTDLYHFTLNGSVPNAAWISGTGVVSGGGMAYYDTETSAAAGSSLGRPLYRFTCQDDDPTVNSSADSAFLAARLKSHVDQIRAFVLASYSGAKFELLYPDDVNHASCVYTAAVPYPQGGRLNHAVSFPSQWSAPATSGLDRVKIEALSWGAQYRSVDLAKSSMGMLPNWPPTELAYLVPWFNGGCPWALEFLAAINTENFELICFWAYDHLILMSWPIPLPQNAGLALAS